MNKRIVALDIGDVRIGIAVSDPTRTIATPVEVLRRVGWGPDTRAIKALCDRYETNEILSGLPLNMDGTEGFQARKIRDFCRQLENAGLKVLFQDERLTTVAAEDALLEDNMSRMDRKNHVDKVAAALILQQWLDEQAAAPKEEPMANKLPHESPEEARPSDEEEDLIELIDEEGQSTYFEHLATLEYQGASYLALSPAEDSDADGQDADELEVLILKIEQDETGQDIYVQPDDDVQEAVFETFMAMIDNMDENAED